MFDVATRPQPARTASAVFSVPFDWRLTAPASAASYPFIDFSSAIAVPGTEMLQTYGIELEEALNTAVILSLFSDRRAGRDDKLPLHQTDRRGWVGDEFMSDSFDERIDAMGSLLWVCYVTKVVTDVLETARFAAQEALAWMVRDEIASRIAVTTSWAGPRADRLAVRPQIYRPGEVLPVYDVLWGTSLTRAIE